jgi:hypothetical protein
MKILNYLQKITKTEIELLKEKIQTSPVCSPMNQLTESEIQKGGGVHIWLNPNNQRCFNYGWFEYQDYYDWLEGRGKIVKGKTDEEKQKFFEVAKFEKEHDYGWTVSSYKKYFPLIDDSYYPKFKTGYSVERACDKPLKLTSKNHEEIISKVFGSICGYYSDLKITCNSNAQKCMHSELVGAKETLFALGIGYYGANNTPEEILNLAWAADLCLYKAFYRYFEINNIPLPDFDFVYNYKII